MLPLTGRIFDAEHGVDELVEIPVAPLHDLCDPERVLVTYRHGGKQQVLRVDNLINSRKRKAGDALRNESKDYHTQPSVGVKSTLTLQPYNQSRGISEGGAAVRS